MQPPHRAASVSCWVPDVGGWVPIGHVDPVDAVRFSEDLGYTDADAVAVGTIHFELSAAVHFNVVTALATAVSLLPGARDDWPAGWNWSPPARARAGQINDFDQEV